MARNELILLALEPFDAGAVCILPVPEATGSQGVLMSIEVTCEGCGKRYKAPESAAGKKLRCKSCGAAIAVPAGDFDPFENADALLAMEPTTAPVDAAPYFPPPKASGGSSRTPLLIAAGAGGVVVIVAVVMAVLHFGKSTPESSGDASAQKKGAHVSIPENRESRHDDRSAPERNMESVQPIRRRT
jgi:hypothetical protein